MLGGRIFILVLISTFFSGIAGLYRSFQNFSLASSQIWTLDSTDDDLTLVTALSNGIQIYTRTSREAQFVEGDLKIGVNIKIVDITPTGDYLLGIPGSSSQDIRVLKKNGGGTYDVADSFRQQNSDSLGGFLTDDHQWVF